ncbi:hypothetical protein Tco_0723266, partial [Tanacetum coccineum]
MSARIGIAEDMPEISGFAPASPTLGELLKYVTESMDDGNRNEISARDLEMNQTNELPQSLPFVLSFTNLTYSVKVRSKLGLPNMFGRPSTPSPAAVAGPVGRESLSSRSKVLLNDISGEARDG